MDALRLPLEDRLGVLEALVRETLVPAEADGGGESAFALHDYSTLAAYFLLDLDQEGGVETFITPTLQKLLQQLSRSTTQQPRELRGQVRGRVLWAATYKARYSGDYDPDLFVCGEVRHRYDTPENQLLKYMMEQIMLCSKAVPPAIRQGMCYLPASETRASLFTGARLAQMETTMHLLWRNVRLHEITVPQQVTEFHLLRAETSRLEEYGLVARLFHRYRAVVLEPSWEELARVGRRVVPLPASLGEAEMPWVRLAARLMRAREGA